jgi:hypothetical protein
VDIANAEAALAQFKAVANRIGNCYIDPVSATTKAGLSVSARQRIEGQVPRALEAARRAAECARLIAAGQKPPGPGAVGDAGGDPGGGTGEGEPPPVVTASGGGGDSKGEGDTQPGAGESGGGGETDPSGGGTPPAVAESTGDPGEPAAGGEPQVTGILAPIGRTDGKITEDEYDQTQVTIRGADGRERLYSGERAADELVKAGYLTKRGKEYFPTARFRSFGGPGTGSGDDEESSGGGTADLPVKKRPPTTAGGGPTSTGGGGGATTAQTAPPTTGPKPPTTGGGGGSGGAAGGGSPGGVKLGSGDNLFGHTVGLGLECTLKVTGKVTTCNKSRCGVSSTAEIPDDATLERRRQLEACMDGCRKDHQSQFDACPDN